MWHRDISVEQMLGEIGIEFKYKTGIPLKQLKVRESLKNNARNIPLDEDTVMKYAHDMAKGVSFPALVITGNGFSISGISKNQIGDGFILSGNQRADAAQKSGQTTVDAYIVKSCSQEQMDDFIRRDNTRHGRPSSEDEKIQACVWIHRRHGRSLKALCSQYFGNNARLYGRICNANIAETVSERLLQASDIQVDLPQSSLVVMNPIPDASVLCDVYRLASAYGLTAAEIDKLVSDICREKSESERHKVVVDKKDELNHRVKTGTMRKDVLLRKHLTSFRNALARGCNGSPFPPLCKIITNKKQQAEFKGVIDQIIMGLKCLKGKAR